MGGSMDLYKLFVSRSFDQSDAEVIKPVLEFCKAVGFEPVDTERATSTVPVDKVRDAISDSRAFLGLLTRDTSGSAGSTRTHDWVTTEIGMAEFARLPIVLFVEEGVEYRPGEHITSYGKFSREDPQGLWQALVRSLCELRENPSVRAGGTVELGSDNYRFLVDDVELEVKADGRLRYTRFIEVESRVPELRQLFPIHRIITSSQHLGYFDGTLEFQGLPSHSTPSLRREQESPRDVSFIVEFDPPLSEGDRASFSVTHESRGSLPLVMDDIELLRKLDYMAGKLVSRQGHAIRVPTDRFSLRVEFPSGYQITDCLPKATVTLRNGAGSSQLSRSEAERVQAAFKVRHNRLEVEIEQPKLDHAYYFEWHPPRADALPEGLDLRLGLPEA